MTSMFSRLRFLVAGLSAALALSACGGNEPEIEEVHVAFASFDVAIGDNQRILAGLRTSDAAIVAFGHVEFALAFIGDEAVDQVVADQTIQARFLAVPGAEPSPTGDTSTARPLRGESGVGVYAGTVDLDRAGRWVLQVTAELGDGSLLRGTTVFVVQDAPLVPAAGSPAPRVANLTIADVEAGRAPANAVDSRAGTADGQIPATSLHDTSIIDALDAGERIVVGVTTPVYCVSQFCGPLTDTLADLAEDYGDVARFIHIEVWQDFERAQLTDAAAAWIQTEIGGNEPWVFAIGEDGTVQRRWDNVLDVAELVEWLER